MSQHAQRFHTLDKQAIRLDFLRDSAHFLDTESEDDMADEKKDPPPEREPPPPPPDWGGKKSETDPLKYR
jgi:hypothetical protein